MMKITERKSLLRRKVYGIAAMSFFLSMLLQAVSLIPVMMMPSVIDTYIPAGETGKVILLDEATSQMDAATQDIMAKVLREEQKSRGATVLSVAHRLEFNRFADETISVE